MEKQIYIAPQVEVLKVKVEQGFAATDGGGNLENPLDGETGEW